MKLEIKLLPRHKLTLSFVLRALCLGLIIIGAYKAYTFTAPLQTDNFYDARGSLLGDDVMANYDLALDLYKQERYDAAAKFIKAAQNALVNERGELVESDKLRAAQILFVSGLISEASQKGQQAVDAYKDALRLNPKHAEAKYNLERLLQPSGGPGGPGKVPAGGTGSGNKKGI